ncbi:hypothetical protein ACH5RR_013671 [Cinchona calisaya]|uniref:Uncharacterized protein n=1 Tax=Cinchona calisaya TaxID=153742 RepID=A0ABD3A0P0_9GENT
MIYAYFFHKTVPMKRAQTAFEANAEMDVEESINLEESFENDPQTLEDEVMNNLLARQRSKSKASSSSDSRGTKRKLTSLQALYLNSGDLRVKTKSELNELRKVDLDQIQMLKGVDLMMHD